MAKLKNVSKVVYGSNDIKSMYYKGEKVWPAGLEPGVVWECLTPKLSGSGTPYNLTISEYVSEAGLGGVVTAEGNSMVGVRAGNYNSLSFHVNSGTTSYTTPSTAYLVSKSEIPVSSDLMFTCTLPGETNSTIGRIYKNNRNFTLGTDALHVNIKHDRSKSELVTPEGTMLFTFPTDLNKSGSIGDVRIRLTEGVCKVYLGNSLLTSMITTSPTNIGKLRFGADGIYYKFSFFSQESRGGPAVANFCYYTGQEAKNRADIWGLT